MIDPAIRKHTAVPWTLSIVYTGKDRQHTDYVIRGPNDNMPDGAKVAIVADGRHALDPKPNEESAANARIMVASPKMLKALDRIALMACGCSSRALAEGIVECASCIAREAVEGI